MRPVIGLWLLTIALVSPLARAADAQPLTGTEPLTMEGDIAAQLVAGVDKFLLRKIDESVDQREQYWKRDFSSAEAYNKSIEPNRKRLAHMLGVRDQRVKFDALEGTWSSVGHRTTPSTRGIPFCRAYVMRWPVLSVPGPTWPDEVSVYAEGLLIIPPRETKQPIADVIVIPDAGQTPEQQMGFAEGIPPELQYARRLAESGCRVIIPTLISRDYRARNGRAKMTNREYVYRSAFEMGRHLIGYEVQKVLAGVDWMKRNPSAENRSGKIGVLGYGEGGAIAIYAAAIDPRIDVTCVSGYFDNRNSLWQQPLDRNVFGLLKEFGDAELASMCVGRDLIIADVAGPVATLPSEGGAPATLVSPQGCKAEFARFLKLVDRTELSLGINRVENDGVEEFFGRLHEGEMNVRRTEAAAVKQHDLSRRQTRQLAELDRHNQALLAESAYVRKARFWDKVDTSSVEAYKKSIAPFREEFKRDVIGAFDDKPLPFNPRTRKTYDEEKWTGYEVVLDLWPDVFCYGILCLPKDLKLDGSERRPVVVCQHGLEGRPQDVVKGDHRAYHDFASKLCERGFITFAPQNLYIGQDKFRTLQRKANPLGKTLFSIIVPQHQQICDWMQTLPYVDGERVAFYGLSYGGKSAMRIPPLVSDYCLSICSADFNEWVDKNASTRGPYSYVWTGEYEIFEWDLGSTFNYAEMAALIAPRPFMVERGHFDGVGTDENVAYEFAKVRNLYAARLKLPEDRCQIEWFVGPHTINGKGTFEFLHQHLKWPQ